MAFRQSLDYLYGLQQFGIKLGLENIRSLLQRLGDPQQSYPALHLAGTNGKGSTAAALATVLQANGLRVGLYTSPHLYSFTERIQVDRQQISEADVVRLTETLKGQVAELPITFFEFTTALALEYFREQRVDVAVLETGLGGRLDATNVVTPVLSLITPVAIDHQQYLGNDLTTIAREKGGIIKPGVPVLLAPQDDDVCAVLQAQATAVGASCLSAGRDWTVCGETTSFTFKGCGWELDQLRSGLPGRHQLQNLGLALAAAATLTAVGWPLDPQTAGRSLAGLNWPGRLEWWPKIDGLLLDAAHNPAGARTLADFLRESEAAGIHLVTGFKGDKDWRTILEKLVPLAQRVYVTRPEFEQVVEPLAISAYLRGQGCAAEVYELPEAALQAALKQRRQGEVVVVAGSIFLVSAVRNWLRKQETADAS